MQKRMRIGSILFFLICFIFILQPNTVKADDDVKNGWVVEDGNKHYYEDGVMLRNCTPIIDGNKYIFTGSGNLAEGWFYLGSTWKLYCDPENDCIVATGLYHVGDEAYLFNKDGVVYMLARNEIIDGKKYWFNHNGSLAKGWQRLLNWRMYFDEYTYEAAIGKKDINGTTYFFDKNGVLYQNATPFVEGHKYIIGGDGTAYTGWYDLTSYWRMYADPAKGGALLTGIQTIGDKTYLFNSDGVLHISSRTEVISGQKYWFNSDGSLSTGWQTLLNWRMYFDPNTYIAKIGWNVIGGKEYYFNKDGVMMTNTTIDGKQLGADGVVINESHTWTTRTATASHEEEGYWDYSVIKAAWTETIYHEEEGYYAPAVTPRSNIPLVPIYENKEVYGPYICDTCGEEMSSPHEHYDQTLEQYYNGEIDSSQIHSGAHVETISYETVIVGYEPDPNYVAEYSIAEISEDEGEPAPLNEVWVKTRDAWTENVSHDAVTEPIWVKTKEAWTETISYEVCNHCGEVRVDDFGPAEGAKLYLVGKNQAKYKTIGEAVAAIKQEIPSVDASSSNPIVACIMIEGGTYNESISLGETSGIAFVGLDQVNWDSAEAYPAGCVYIKAANKFYNIDFHATGNIAYAMHYEAGGQRQDTNNPVGFYDCGFYATNNASVGIGSAQRNTNIIFQSCIFSGDSVRDVYFHNAVASGSLQNTIQFTNCQAIKTGVIWIDDAARLNMNDNSELMLNFTNNTFYVMYLYTKEPADSQNTLYNHIPNTNTNIFLDPDSSGNRVYVFNYDK